MEDTKKKERHIVSWTQQEDDILREQITLHGTENWAIIASKFKDKTTRQCRRRWYTYLNSDFKKGGWSPEEDMLLCEAQKIFGNRWTEIAKVVSGRTDNAVKNRFSTLCKKRAKYEALAKENSATSLLNTNNKRFLVHNGTLDGSSEFSLRIKRIRRTHLFDFSEKLTLEGIRSHQQERAPFSVLIQNELHSSNAKETVNEAQSNISEGAFLKRDDPKISALVQQGELLSSLALKVNAENSDQSLENAWKVFQDFLKSKENGILGCSIPDNDLQPEDIKDLIEDLRSSNDGSQWRQPGLHESPGSSDYSTGSTLLSHTAGEVMDQTQAGEQNGDIFECCGKETDNVLVDCATSSMEFGSPTQVVPLFRSLAAGIPSPQFSESERNFLLKTLGVESPSLNPSAKSSQPPPPCKRALLQSL